jgi:hypothetical protein
LLVTFCTEMVINVVNISLFICLYCAFMYISLYVCMPELTIICVVTYRCFLCVLCVLVCILFTSCISCVFQFLRTCVHACACAGVCTHVGASTFCVFV